MPRALLTLVGLGLLFALGGMPPAHAQGALAPRAATSSHGPAGGGASPLLGSSTMHAATTSPRSSSSPTPPAKRTPTKKTDNSPVLVYGGAIGALLVIGVIAAVARTRLKDDE